MGINGDGIVFDAAGEMGATGEVLACVSLTVNGSDISFVGRRRFIELNSSAALFDSLEDSQGFFEILWGFEVLRWVCGARCIDIR